MNSSRYPDLVRRRGAARAAAVLAMAWLLAAAAPAPDSVLADDSVASEIQARLEVQPPTEKIAGEIVDGAALADFYRARDWKPAWDSQAAELEKRLAEAGDDGLGSLPLHLREIGRRIGSGKAAMAADGDMLLTDAVLRYVAAMRGQRVDPSDIEDDWLLPSPDFNAVAFVEKHQTDIVAALGQLAPPYYGYQLLREALAKLRAVRGDWPKVAPGPTLRQGQTDPRIAELRWRLAATGELGEAAAEGETLDAPLVAALARFQQTHGLDADGAMGPATVRALDAGPEQRARMIALNMERWRWLPPKFEDVHIVVNVPAEQLELDDGGKVALAMKAIVGDLDHPTPALHARLTNLVLNPTWHVPASIATDEILPELQKNPGYLIANDLELVGDKFAPGSPESQGVGIDWKSMTHMPWPVRQRPGSDNALGRIKFNMPNDDDIYLHDTPKHKLFDRFDRALSHGCVRVEDADALALYLLRDKGWTKEQLDAEIDKGETKTIALPKSVPVWLLYFTAWVDADGTLEFRDDLYERDQRLAVALSQASKSPILVARAVQNPHKVICEGCRVP